MLKVLDRYIIWSLIQSFVICLVGMLALYILIDGFEKLEACRQQRLVHLSEFFPKNQVPPAPYVINREKAKNGILSCLPDTIDPRRGR